MKKILPLILMLILCSLGIVFVFNQQPFDLSKVYFNSILFWLIIFIIHLIVSSFPTALLCGVNRYLLCFWLQRLSLVSNYVTPFKIGIPIKIYLFNKIFKVKAGHVTSALLVELFTRFILLLITVLYFGGLQYSIEDPLYTIIIILLAIIVGIIIIKKPYNNYFKLISKTYPFIDDIMNALKNNLFSAYKIITVTFISGIILFLAIIRVFVIAKGLNIDDISFMSISKAVLLTIFISDLSFIPGGYVVREVSLVYFLSIAGVPYTSATIIALLDRFFQTSLIFILGSTSILVLKNFYLINLFDFKLTKHVE